MATDPEIFKHKEWLGLLQPVGLVVSPIALVKGQATIDRARVVELQERLQGKISDEPMPESEEAVGWIEDFPAFAEQVLEWLPEDLVRAEDLPETLAVALPDYGETLKPTYAVRDIDTDSWLMLIQEVKLGQSLDEVDPAVEKGQGWKATVQEKFERLLRETEVPVGLLCNGTHLRLVYAPRGESSGHLTFPVQAMCEVAGRSILGALEMLLGAGRLFNVPIDRRLPKLLSDSRDYQAEVSTKLADQVLDALWELLRGFQTADAAVNGRLFNLSSPLSPVWQREPEGEGNLQHIYGGLIATLMRLVFLLYAEDRGLMPGDEIYQRNYAVTGLYDRLREDVGNYPDTMEQRYGAWAWLLSLFRLVYDGGGATPEYLPARHGQLFDPDEYPFLEGRTCPHPLTPSPKLGEGGQEAGIPRIPDGVIYRILDKLLLLDGERLSYRALDVEQIGSVYEAIMGFEVKVACGESIALRPKDVVVDISEIVAAPPKDRDKLLQQADCKITGQSLTALKAAKTPIEVVAALERKVSGRTPNLLPVGSLYLQPGEERRRTGSHYTPRKLTQPIVETTLAPVLNGLGTSPSADRILKLRVCDLAMGSGAFLVEACRQLADRVVAAWEREKREVEGGEEPLLLARRLVAQCCLYGVDKNPFAVNLAKLSLWLVTLSKDRPFTFLDHALKCGDSLVGLTQQEIGSFGKDPLADLPLMKLIKAGVDRAKFCRSQIQLNDTRTDEDMLAKSLQWQQVERELAEARVVGDVAIAAFFDGVGKSKKGREEVEQEYNTLVCRWRQQRTSESEEYSSQVEGISRRLHSFQKPFNWEIEFPEVFDRENPGFDAIVGNPPFLGGRRIKSTLGDEYIEWLPEKYPESSKNGDLSAFFFRRAFELLRKDGCLGLIATNTIAQGDTRSTGLRFICNNGGTIYAAQKRLKWPGLAAVVVSVLNIYKGNYKEIKKLDRKEVFKVSAFLFPKGGNENPAVLLANAEKSFQGCIVLGMGFTFDDTNPEATPIAEMHRLIEKDSKNAERIFPYIGGEEVNSSPTHTHHRYAINFFDMSEEESRKWTDLMQILEEKVKPERTRKNSKGDFVLRSLLPQKWWQYADKRPALFRAIAQCDRVLVTNAQASTHLSFIFYRPDVVFANSLNIFPLQRDSDFAVLQSRIHEIWAIFFGSSLEDRLRYNPSDCFETFPFPENWETESRLETIGQEYYEYRAELMIRNNQGLTATYNRFHDPEERHPDILQLRQLHAKMDRAVLDAYGWTDIPADCEFLLDYEEEDLTPNPSTSRGGGKKKPWRYRWPEEVHDEVLARLLDLNQKRYEAEILGGKQAENKAKSKQKRKPKATPSTPSNVHQQTLFDP
jgi:N-6 DNA Methylase